MSVSQRSLRATSPFDIEGVQQKNSFGNERATSAVIAWMDVLVWGTVIGFAYSATHIFKNSQTRQHVYADGLLHLQHPGDGTSTYSDWTLLFPCVVIPAICIMFFNIPQKNPGNENYTLRFMHLALSGFALASAFSRGMVRYFSHHAFVCFFFRATFF